MRVVANSKKIIESGYRDHLGERTGEIDHLFETCVIDGKQCVRPLYTIFVLF